MRKYLVSVATELDGHASSEVYYLETDKFLKAKDIVMTLFGTEVSNNEIEIDMERDSQVYGRLYGDYAFALTCTYIPKVERDTLYEASARTG